MRNKISKPLAILTVQVSSAMIAFLLLGQSFAIDNNRQDPNKLFYAANNLYEKQEYEKAIEEYVKMLDIGLESGSLYYNIGNGFFKLGKLGYAILCYEKARRFIPRDSDLKSNLNYARSLTGAASPQISTANFVVRAVKAPFRDFNLNAVAISALILYLLVMLVSAILIPNPLVYKKFKLLFILVTVGFILNLGSFAVRYYDEEILRHGIVVQQAAECKYEPIDKSTTYYTLQEGDEVSVLKTRNGWRQIRRLDGKTAWVKKEAVEEI